MAPVPAWHIRPPGGLASDRTVLGCLDMGTGAMTAARREQLAGAGLFLLLVLGLPLGLARTTHVFSDGDTSWHIAAGRWMLEHRSIPTADPFSFTRLGHPWVAMEWPAELAFAASFDLAGFAGVAALVAAALMALHAIVYLHLCSRVGPVALAVAILALDIGLAPFMLARPHLLAWPLLAGWTALLLRAADSGRPPPLWGALLMLVWTNLHGGFPLAFLIAAPIALDALVAARWATLRGWLLFALASLAATLANLNGLAGLLQPFHVARLETLHLIVEWQPSSIAGTPFFYGLLLAGTGALLWRGIRLPPGRLLLMLGLLAMAFTQVRHQSAFVIVAALVVPPLLGRPPERAAHLGWLWAAAIPFVALRALVPFTPGEGLGNPRSLIAAVPAELRREPVLNGYSFGGPLILAGIRPYIDGRSEMYGDAFVRDYMEIFQGDMTRFDRAVNRHDIRWTILPNTATSLVRNLDSSPRWTRLHSDKVGVIHVRRNPVPSRKN